MRRRHIKRGVVAFDARLRVLYTPRPEDVLGVSLLDDHVVASDRVGDTGYEVRHSEIVSGDGIWSVPILLTT